MKKLYIKLRDSIASLSERMNQYPIYGAILVIITYFMIDNTFIGSLLPKRVPNSIIIVSMIMVLGLLFIVYVSQVIRNTRDAKLKRYAMVGFLVTTLIAIAFTFGYDTVIAKLLPTLFQRYTKAKVLIIVVIAPILEELAYRYLLYDKWAKPKLGTFKAVLIVGIVFIVTHPITNMSGLLIYWLPTLFFFSVYDLGGLYPTILVHMIFNIIALM